MIVHALLVFGAEGHFLMSVYLFLEVKQTMPNAKVLEEKKALVASMVEKIKNSPAGVLVDYKGINVAGASARHHRYRDQHDG